MKNRFWRSVYSTANVTLASSPLSSAKGIRSELAVHFEARKNRLAVLFAISTREQKLTPPARPPRRPSTRRPWRLKRSHLSSTGKGENRAWRNECQPLE